MHNDKNVFVLFKVTENVRNSGKSDI